MSREARFLQEQKKGMRHKKRMGEGKRFYEGGEKKTVKKKPLARRHLVSSPEKGLFGIRETFVTVEGKKRGVGEKKKLSRLP